MPAEPTQLLELIPLSVVNREDMPIGDLGLGSLDRMAQHEVVGRFTSGVSGPAQDGVLFGGKLKLSDVLQHPRLFAQFYREQLAENVRMGMQQAVRQGKWVNRPKTGYDLIDGELVPNEMAPVVRHISTMRGGRQSGQDR